MAADADSRALHRSYTAPMWPIHDPHCLFPASPSPARSFDPDTPIANHRSRQACAAGRIRSGFSREPSGRGRIQALGWPPSGRRATAS